MPLQNPRTPLFPYTALFRSWEKHQVARCFALLKAQEPRPGQEDLRGFEWYYWRKQFQRGHITLTGHTLSVNSVDRKSTRLNSSHPSISYAVFCLKQNNSRRA